MYDSNQGAITTALTNTSTAVFTEATINSILALVSSNDADPIVVDQVTVTNNGTVEAAEGTELVFVSVSDTAQTTVTVDADIPVVLFQGAGGVNATFGSAAATGAEKAAADDPQGAPGDPIERIIVGTAGEDVITIADDKGTHITVGGRDTVNAGTGHTIVVAAEGSSTVNGGGDTMIQAVGDDDDFTVTAEDGRAVIMNSQTGVEVDISNVQFVQLDDGDALIFADNDTEAAVANLYQAVFGRTADAGGLDYWFEQAANGLDLGSIAGHFLDSAEYTDDGLTDAEFIAELYQNALGRAGDAGGVEYWIDVLEGGTDRSLVVAQFATVAADHVELQEVNVVGSVTVVEGIVTG
ncbi:DUF4214 domain-containing protein [Pseudoduganella lutea]|uniref:DUF4214 domain-containing protein n=1 Tax=Pseudoduganella lutea TaxID=321985 RepID=A0A4P6L0P3_9BURK|nr:DUF4214 domain-containing protein [Pseudoduganella lutea]QBE64814.1 DUF4214 domain-containing protein [Pseudoduganella lutea]